MQISMKNLTGKLLLGKSMTIAKFYAVIWLFAIAIAIEMCVDDTYNAIDLFIFALLVSALLFVGIFGVIPQLIQERLAKRDKN